MGSRFESWWVHDTMRIDEYKLQFFYVEFSFRDTLPKWRNCPKGPKGIPLEDAFGSRPAYRQAGAPRCAGQAGLKIQLVPFHGIWLTPDLSRVKNNF
ncbi:MAG: hypothetical protein HY088_06815 [Ignavibacteriales bacterium]|nr:hypothetical protein [Ignavibacteriales bacterium]